MALREIADALEREFQKRLLYLWRTPPAMDESTFWVSELPFCERKMWLRRVIGAREPPRPRMVHGALLHRAAFDVIRSIFPSQEIRAEVPVEQEFNGIRIRGRVDFLVGDVPIELKESSVLRTGPRELFLAYKQQLNAYLNLLNVGTGLLVIVDPRDFSVTVKRVRRNRKQFDALLRKAARVRRAILERKLPARGSAWECENPEYACGFRVLCAMLPASESRSREKRSST